MEMPKSSTRAALPAAATPPEYTAAGATLASITPKSVTNAAFNPVGATCHSASHSTPASTPSAANSSAGCGPESPIGIGKGGNSRAAPRNNASHRAGFCKVHQRTGATTAGAASTALRGRLRVTAIAAAHTPNSAGAHQAGRCSEALFMRHLGRWGRLATCGGLVTRSEEHTSELQSRQYLVCRLLLGK